MGLQNVSLLIEQVSSIIGHDTPHSQDLASSLFWKWAAASQVRNVPS
jgi:hypothetical protein